jgi:hypothetical protein
VYERNKLGGTDVMSVSSTVAARIPDMLIVLININGRSLKQQSNVT